MVRSRSRRYKKYPSPVIKLPSFSENPDSYKDYGQIQILSQKLLEGECAA